VQIDKNKLLVAELSKYLPDKRAELTPAVVRVRPKQHSRSSIIEAEAAATDQQKQSQQHSSNGQLPGSLARSL
jgi:hypothetical protein